VSLRNRLSRLEKMSGDPNIEEVHAFFRSMQEYRDDPEVGAAVVNLSELMVQAEAAQGHEMTTREWFDDRWRDSWGLSDALKRLIRAVLTCEDRTAEKRGGDK
jgi:hypothetical protein